MNRSADKSRNQMQRYIERCEAKAEVPRSDYLDMYRKEIENDLLNEQDHEWQKNNLEYDLRSTEWICSKVKGSSVYAQNLYAALCNNNFQPNQVWPLLKGQTWSCSWRYAGGIVAHMRESGDYIDWYCTGIRSAAVAEDSEEYKSYTAEQQTWHHEAKQYVSESTVTDEVCKDLLELGWIVIKEQHDQT